jgi:hypothetical protein
MTDASISRLLHDRRLELLSLRSICILMAATSSAYDKSLADSNMPLDLHANVVSDLRLGNAIASTHLNGRCGGFSCV